MDKTKLYELLKENLLDDEGYPSRTKVKARQWEARLFGERLIPINCEEKLLDAIAIYDDAIRFSVSPISREIKAVDLKT